MNNPLVSVIIPNYNHARFLDERICSILNQSYLNYELIILDDASTDNSLEIINKYKENPHISHIVVNDTNSGSPFKQWSKGFGLAKGDLIWIAESDDACSPLFLEKMVYIHSSQHIVVSFSRSQQVDEDGRLSVTRQNEITQDSLWSGMVFIEAYLGRYNIVANVSSAVFRKTALASLPTDYLDYKGAGDWLFWIELCRQGDVAFCGEPLNYFRRLNGSITTKCVNNGVNLYEGKSINEYLYATGLISKSTYRYNVRNNIFKIQNNRKLSPEAVRDDLLKVWGANKIDFKFRMMISRLLNKLNSIVWK